MVVGDNLFLLCTNTAKSMAEIAADPLWLDAQAEFVEMSERFGADPLAKDSLGGKEEIRM